MRLVLLTCGLAGAILGIYFVSELFFPNWLGAPEEYLNNSFRSAILSMAILSSDLLLPIPSSLVMTLNGAIFGVSLGMLISMGGCLGCATIGYVLGYRSSKIIKKILSEREQHLAEKLMNKWGILAIVMSKPLPVLSECMSLYCGLCKVPFRKYLLASFVGCLPPSFIYAYAGSFLDQADLTVFVFAGVMLLSGLLWWFTKFIAKT